MMLAGDLVEEYDPKLFITYPVLLQVSWDYAAGFQDPATDGPEAWPQFKEELGRKHLKEFCVFLNEQLLYLREKFE
jgi:hypothetical protein